MTRSARRRELEAERQAFEARQAAREAACIHWHCEPKRCDWQGRITHIHCLDCGGINEVTYDT